MMDQRDRFLRAMQFQSVDRLPDFEFGYWEETVDRWHAEGLPLELKNDRDVELYFKLEGWDCGEWMPVVTGIWPTPPSRIIREEWDKQTIDDGIGGIYVRKRRPYLSVPHYLRYPIRKREDWNALKVFLDPDTPGRFPLNWGEIADGYRDRTYPLGIFVGSLYGWLRNWMGVERLSLAFYKEPDWVEEMMDTLTNLWIQVLCRVLRDVTVDYAHWWEDMCYNRGPLLSVGLFGKFMVPRYKRVTDLLNDHNVKINSLDCDGRITELVPGWLKGGINCMFPLEAAHTDPFELRKAYGRKVLLIGGVNKLALMGSKGGIEAELKRLEPLMREGGYIPTVDHRVPPEVSLDNYNYYLKMKRMMIGRVTE